MKETLQLETTALGTTAHVSPDDPAIQPEALRSAVEQLAETRRQAVSAKVAYDSAQVEFRLKNEVLVRSYEELRDTVAAMEASLRVLAVQRFRVVGDRDPAPGLEIKDFDVVEKDVEACESLAIQRGVAITVDHTALDKIIKADPRAWATARVIKEPRAQLARDLDKALAVAAIVADQG